MQRWHRALHRRNVQVDIVPAARVGEGYDVAIAPLLYLVREADAAALVSFVEGGGHLLAGPFTDVVDELDRFRDGGFATQLGPLCGIRIEDFGALVAPDAVPGAFGEREAPFAGAESGAPAGVGTLLAEEVHVVADDTQVEASFTAGRRTGDPALTARAVGGGSARYLATIPDEAGVQAVVDRLLAATGVEPVAAGLPEHVEAARRGTLLTLINHGGPVIEVDVAVVDAVTGERVARVRLDAYDLAMVLTD